MPFLCAWAHLGLEAPQTAGNYLSEEFREGLPFAVGAGGSPPLPGKAVILIPWPPTEQPKVLGKGCAQS